MTARVEVNIYYVMGVAMISLGVVMVTLINRRRFYRRNAHGLQQFRTYSGSVTTRWLERLLKLIAIMLILLGLGAIFTGYSFDKGQTTETKVFKRARAKVNQQ